MSLESGVRSLDLRLRLFTFYPGNFVRFLYKCIPRFTHLSNGDQASSGQGIGKEPNIVTKHHFFCSFNILISIMVIITVKRERIFIILKSLTTIP